VSSTYPKYASYQKKKKESYYQRLMGFITNARRVLKIANKPTRKEYYLVFKICSIGTIILGALSYVIQLIFNVALPIGK
jgi:protein translocase SEC61 complex gamma subunit